MGRWSSSSVWTFQGFGRPVSMRRIREIDHFSCRVNHPRLMPVAHDGAARHFSTRFSYPAGARRSLMTQAAWTTRRAPRPRRLTAEPAAAPEHRPSRCRAFGTGPMRVAQSCEFRSRSAFTSSPRRSSGRAHENSPSENPLPSSAEASSSICSLRTSPGNTRCNKLVLPHRAGQE